MSSDAAAAQGPCAGLRIDAHGIVVQANAALCRLMGLAVEDITGQPFDWLLTGASRVLYQSYLQPLLRMHGNVEEVSLALKSLSGPPVDVLFYSTRRSEGAGAGVDVILAPIRRRRGIEEEMLRIKRAADQAPGMIFQLLLRPDGTQLFPFVSEAVRRLYGTTPERAGESAEAILGLIHPPDRDRLLAELQAAGDAGQDWSGVFRVQLPDGSPQWHEMHCTPRDLAGGMRVWHGHMADVTQRQAMEAALAERAVAGRMNEMRSEFLARVSHELRTPLNGILGFTQLLRSEGADPLTTVQRERLSVIAASGQHLLQLVDQLLDISSLEALQSSVELQPLPLAAALAEALDILRSQADEAGVRLPPVPDQAPVWVLANGLRLRQVLVNLLSNAIKYNRCGGQVMLRVQPQGDRVDVAIQDTGPGLSLAQQAQLFQPFNRLGAERTGTPGSGLGLVITRHLLTLMGGSIEVSSTPGQGCTFVFSLPAHGVQAGSRTPPPPADHALASRPLAGTRGRVLCVEDNPVNAILMEGIIGMRPGVDLRVVPDGRSALVLLTEFTPDLLLLDMHLPDMLGTELLAAIRLLPAGAGVPAVAVSAAARDDDIARATAGGFDHYWTKPLDIDRTLAELDRLLGPPAAG